MFDELFELTTAGVARKQRSVTRLFPEFPARVRSIGDLGGIRLVKQGPDVWQFKIHSGTKETVWYDAYIRFKDIQGILQRNCSDQKLWTKDKQHVNLTKLAKKMLHDVDVQLLCSCPADLYWGKQYIRSLSKYDAKYTNPETRPPKIRNPRQYGAMCKHLQVLMNVLPWYISTLAKWLRDTYTKDIAYYEEEVKKERGDYDQPEEEEVEESVIRERGDWYAWWIVGDRLIHVGVDYSGGDHYGTPAIAEEPELFNLDKQDVDKLKQWRKWSEENDDEWMFSHAEDFQDIIHKVMDKSIRIGVVGNEMYVDLPTTDRKWLAKVQLNRDALEKRVQIKTVSVSIHSTFASAIPVEFYGIPADDFWSANSVRDFRGYGRYNESIKEARHKRTQCMECPKPPTVEVLWAEGMGHAWFCNACFKKWATTGDGWRDVCAVKAIQNGEASKNWKDNNSPNIEKEFTFLKENVDQSGLRALLSVYRDAEKGKQPQRYDLLKALHLMERYFKEYLDCYRGMASHDVERYEKELPVVQDYVDRHNEIKMALKKRDTKMMIIALDNAVGQWHIDFPAIHHITMEVDSDELVGIAFEIEDILTRLGRLAAESPFKDIYNESKENNSMELALSNSDKVAIIDSEDYDKVKGYTWRLLKDKRTDVWYVATSVRVGSKVMTIRLHRLIIDALPGREVHHLDLDPLNNRKKNLLVVTRGEHIQIHMQLARDAIAVKDSIQEDLANISDPKLKKMFIEDKVEDLEKRIRDLKVILSDLGNDLMRSQLLNKIDTYEREIANLLRSVGESFKETTNGYSRKNRMFKCT